MNEEDQFVANGMRLTGRQWLLVGAVMAFVWVLGPSLWETIEPFEPGTAYRVPHEMSEDYWLWARWSRRAAGSADVLLLGDSVVWGEYAPPAGTLSAHMDALDPDRRYANLGLAGMHPQPLAGLIEHYGGAIAGKDVILQCNLLWMSSPRHDLQDEKESSFNHPALLPQFTEEIPAYRKPFGDRLSVVVRRTVPFFGWTRHLQVASFDQKDVPAWALEHPYDNPLSALTLDLPEPGTDLRHGTRSWKERGYVAQDLDWVAPDTSVQWRGFKRLVRTLRDRENDVLVLVGPFNEHMLTDAGREGYLRLKEAVTGWLNEQGVPYFAPDPLPEELYGDASHPLDAGYKLLAERVLDHRRSLTVAIGEEK